MTASGVAGARAVQRRWVVVVGVGMLLAGVAGAGAVQRRWVVVVGVGMLLAGAAGARAVQPAGASTNGIVSYIAPAVAEVVDPFRPPDHIGGSGNRGLEYATPPWSVIVAAADGVVEFAGQVPFTLAVTVAHADGARTTYTGLSEIWIHEGLTVTQGDALGTTLGHVHFGARVGEHYVDPQILIDASVAAGRPRLVPEPDS